jgi:hypothetical protein
MARAALVVSLVVAAAGAALADPAAAPIHVVAPGDTLDAIARARYGSRHYADLIARVDGVDPARLPVAAVLWLPEIDAVAAPLARRVPGGAAALVRAHAAWRAQVAALWDEHRRRHAITARPELALAAADADGARAAFALAGAPTGQLTTLAATLGAVAGGHVDRNAYALDEVDRRFAMSFTALLTWTSR